ncbi:inosine-5'-monophosphate dehydrogenase [archaeon BMS3Bbin15]|nr:inosine-5'-monophosphate dehydrogenase [archaeon BMS3Bbin15]
MNVEDFMTKDVIVIGADESLEEAARKLRKYRISGAPVVEDGNVIGVISEADLLKALEEKSISLNTLLPSPLDLIELPVRVKLNIDKITKEIKLLDKLKIKDIMTKSAITISPEEDISKAARLMRERGINRLPVVKDSKIVGIITRADLLKAF